MPDEFVGGTTEEVESLFRRAALRDDGYAEALDKAWTESDFVDLALFSEELDDQHELAYVIVLRQPGAQDTSLDEWVQQMADTFPASYRLAAPQTQMIRGVDIRVVNAEIVDGDDIVGKQSYYMRKVDDVMWTVGYAATPDTFHELESTFRRSYESFEPRTR